MLPDTRVESDHVAVEPDGPLRALVDRLHAYRERHAGPVWHRGLPSAALTLVIGVGDPIEVAMPGAATPRRGSAVVGGLHVRSAHIEHRGFQHGVQLALRPEAALPLLGVPAGALAGQLVALEDLVGATAVQRIGDRIASAPDLAAAARAAAEELTRLARPRAPAAPVVAPALTALRRTRGAIAVERLAADLGWSRRHLARRFVRDLGLPPKVVARLVRLDHALEAIARDHRTEGLARIAARCGYADHGHLTREVVALTGVSPSRLAAERAVGGSLPVGVGRPATA